MIEIHRVVLPGADIPEQGRRLYVADDVRGAQGRLDIPAKGKAAFDTYFNVVPAAHWVRLSGTGTLVFTCRLEGTGTLTVRCVRDGGTVPIVMMQEECSERTRDVVGELEVTDRDRWVWLEVEAGDQGLVIHNASFWLPTAPKPAALAVGMTTYNRAEDCCRALGDLARLPPSVLTRVVVVDQSDRSITEADCFASASAALGDRLTLIRQRNLGGAGGFSRAMAELTGPGPQPVSHVVLMDDDIVLEPEVVRRLGAVAATGTAHIVGTQMLDLVDPTILYASGEDVSRKTFWWGPGRHALSDLDVSGSVLTKPAGLSKVNRVDFSGWWTCMIPASLIRKTGLAMPFFIKWDDVEYCLRGREEGYPTMMLPGLGIWHVPWTAKDTASDWQAFFLVRNRLVTATLHGPSFPAPLLLHVLGHIVGHLVRMSYSAADLQLWAIEEFLKGPERLHDMQGSGLKPINSRRRQYVDGTSRPLDQLPPAAASAARPRRTAPLSRAGRLPAIVRATLGAFLRTGRNAESIPHVQGAEASWDLLAPLDEVVVIDQSGDTGVLRRRDARLAWSMLGRAAALSSGMMLGWRRCRRDYRASADSVRSLRRWTTVWDSES